MSKQLLANTDESNDVAIAEPAETAEVAENTSGETSETDASAGDQTE